MMVDMLPDASTSVNMFFMEVSLPSPCCPPLQSSPLAEQDAQDLASVLKALADPVRLRLISFIAASEGGEACACNLTEPTGRTQATVSHHLGQLTKAGILAREQRGKWAWFRLDTDRLGAVCAALTATPEYS